METVHAHLPDLRPPDYDCQAHHRSVPMHPGLTLPMPGLREDASTARPLVFVLQAKIAEYLNPAVVGIHDENTVIVGDEQAGWKLELERAAAAFAKVIKQLAIAVEYLHHAERSIGNVDVSFRIDSDTLRTEHLPWRVAELTDYAVGASVAFEPLN